MKQLIKGTRANEHGLTLVEILASIVILAIVLTTFLLVFSQTAKTTHQSEEMIDATYIAQTVMENIYDYSRTIPYSSINETLIADGFQTSSKEDGWDVYRKTQSGKGLYVQIQMIENELEMKRVVVQVFEENDHTRPKAQLENVFTWGASD